MRWHFRNTFQALIVLTLVLTLSRCVCPSPSKEIKRSFEKVNKSLENSNKTFDTSTEKLYDEIKMHRQKNAGLVQKADSVYAAGYENFKNIDALKESLKASDSIGIDLNAAENLLCKSPAGDSLYIKRKKMFQSSINALTDSVNTQQVTSMFADIVTAENAQAWKDAYFKSTPTVGALTVLSKFQNDCVNSMAISLKEIKDQLSKQ